MFTSRRVAALVRVGVFLGVLFVASGASADDADLIAALQSGGHLALMRHATAPGSNDPAEFRIGECSTQRNLSEGGRSQAAEIGARLRANGLREARLVSSQWCRCLDTAHLLSLGGVEELPFLNSLVSYPGRGSEMTRGLGNWIGQQDLDGATILVTHSVNIRALIGISAQEGEIIVVERADGGELSVVGSILSR